MPISTVDLFRPQSLDGVAQILTGGTNVLVSAINNAVQIGRDTANLRATQEREYLAERERNENLNQRRGEFLTRTKQIDRAFFEEVGQDRRNFKENADRDRRDFKYKETTDDRDYNLREATTIQNILNAEERLDIDKEKLNLEKQEREDDKLFLRKRAGDIVEKADPGILKRVKNFFTGEGGNLPEDNLLLGQELKEIGVKLKDPALISRGDEMESKGREGILTRREEIRNTPLPARPSSRKAEQTDEERIVELDRAIKAFDLESSEATAGRSDFEPSDATLLEIRKARIELEDLRKKIAGKSGSKPVEPQEDPLGKYYKPPTK